MYFVTLKTQLMFGVVCGSKAVASYADPLHCLFFSYRALTFGPMYCVSNTDTRRGLGIKLVMNCAASLYSVSELVAFQIFSFV